MEKKISINGLNINYREAGPPDGHPVVLMHGWGCNCNTVKFIEDSISHNRYVFNVDLPGHGLSDEPKDVWGVEDYTTLIENFIQQLDIKKPALIGHSFGGRIAILFASRNEVDKIVLVDAAGIKPKRKLNYYIKIYSFKTLKKGISLIFKKSKAEKLIENLRKKRGSSDYGNSSPMMRNILSKCVNEDLKHVMPKIKAPTLLMWGENDTATPLSDAKIMESLIPDSGLVTFPGCGHYSFLDDPHKFRAVIKKFLEN